MQLAWSCHRRADPARLHHRYKLIISNIARVVRIDREAELGSPFIIL
jgi:hypothetical protein